MFVVDNKWPIARAVVWYAYILHMQQSLFCRETYFQAGPIFLSRVESGAVNSDGLALCREELLSFSLFSFGPTDSVLLCFIISQPSFKVCTFLMCVIDSVVMVWASREYNREDVGFFL